MVLDRDGAQVNIMHEGQYFGEYAVMTKQRRLTTVRSLGRTVVLRLSPEDFMDILSGHPDVWGDQMKRIYGQVSGKHSQSLALSGMRKGLLQHPSNEAPMSKRLMLIQYGILALIFILAALFVPKGSAAPAGPAADPVEFAVKIAETGAKRYVLYFPETGETLFFNARRFLLYALLNGRIVCGFVEIPAR